MEIYLDTSAIINLLKPENEEFHDLILELLKEGLITLLISHGLYDDGFWQSIEHLPKKLVPTGCFVIGYSRLNQARLGDPEGVYGELTKDIPDKIRNRNAIWDAIHYATAHFERVDFFVTDDARLKRKINERIINPIDTIDLISFISIARELDKENYP